MGIVLAYIVGGLLGYAGQPDSSFAMRVHVDADTAAQTTELHLYLSALRVAQEGRVSVFANSLCATPDSHAFDLRFKANVYDTLHVSWPQDVDPGCNSWLVVIQNTQITTGFIPLVHGPRITAE